MKIVFMGTPDIAVGCLQKIIDEKHEILGVVTQPDKPVGRGKKMGMPPVKELALKYDIPVYQPIKARDEEFVQVLKRIKSRFNSCCCFWTNTSKINIRYT